MASLWRYLLHLNLVEVVPNLSKEQLIDIVQRHFMSQLLETMVKNCGDYVHHSSSQSPPPPPTTPPPHWFTGTLLNTCHRSCFVCCVPVRAFAVGLPSPDIC